MRHTDDKKRRLVLFALFSFAVFLLTACATLQQKGYHGLLMRGSIIETSDSGVYVCLGKKDGATVGQELDVYKIKAAPHTKGGFQFTREKTGNIRIIEIVDDHFAKAVIVSGKADINAIVELTSP
jgi:hypothetical protein